MKKLFLLPIMMFALVGCNKPAGGPQTVTFEAADFTTVTLNGSTQVAAELEKDGVKVAFTKVTRYEWSIVEGEDKVQELRIGKQANGSSTMTITGKTITRIDFVSQLDLGSSAYGPTFDASAGEMSSITVGERNQTAYWSGESDNLVLSAKTNQVRAYSFTITYK